MQPLELIFSAARRERRTPFLHCSVSGQATSYAALYSVARRIAAHLTALGIRHTDRVGVFLENRPESVYLSFGLMLLGAAAIPLDPDIRVEELAHILQDAGPVAVIATTEPEAHLAHAAGCARVIGIVQLFQQEHPEFSPAAVTGSDELVIIYSSGTTGMPKGVIFDYQRILVNDLAYGKEMAFSAATHFLQPMPMSHADGWHFSLLLPYLFDATVTLTPRFDSKVCTAFADLLSRFRPNVLIAIPSILEALLWSASRRTHTLEKSLQYVITSSERLSPQLKQDFEAQLQCRVHDLYGLTETGVISLYHNGIAYREGSVGRVHQGVQTRTDANGVLQIKSPYLFRGYCGNRDVAAVSDDGWFETGDIVHIDAEGYLFLRGRTKELINRNGVKVAAHEIDSVVKQHAGVAECYTTAVGDEGPGQEVYCFIVLNEPGASALQSIHQHCRDRLPAVKCPDRFLPVATLPRTRSGKVNRAALLSQLSSLSIPITA